MSSAPSTLHGPPRLRDPGGARPCRGRASRPVTGAVATVLLVLVACGGEDKSKTPSGARASCQSDSDCVVTNTVSCCAACPEAPRAIPAFELERQRNRCAAVDCEPVSDRVECPKVDSVDGYVARCESGTCSAVKR